MVETEDVWKGVLREHILKAIENFDLENYLKNNNVGNMKYYLWYAGRWYPSKCIRKKAFAEKYPGKEVPNFSGGKTDTKKFFEDKRFGCEFKIYHIKGANPLKLQAEGKSIDFEKMVDAIAIDDEEKDDIGPIEFCGIKEKEAFCYPRDPGVKKQALEKQRYKCIIDETHQTFIKRSNNMPYMESHHLVPMAMQGKQKYCLDVPENIVILCCNCHKEIHYGKNGKSIMEKLYCKREEALKRRGINVSLEELLVWYE